MKRNALCFLFVLFPVLLAGCAGPKVIASSTTARGQAKFMYAQDSSQGVIKCRVAEDSRLKDCKELKVNFKD